MAAPSRTSTTAARAPLLGALPADAEHAASSLRGQIVVAYLTPAEARERGLVECLRCRAWHTPGDADECDRRGFIAWHDRREQAHRFDPTW